MAGTSFQREFNQTGSAVGVANTLADPATSTGIATGTPTSGDTVFGSVGGIFKKFAATLLIGTWLGGLTGETTRALAAHLSEHSINVKSFGAKGDGVSCTGNGTSRGASMVNGTTTLTAAISDLFTGFASTDVTKFICIRDRSGTGVAQQGTITVYNSPTSVTVSFTASQAYTFCDICYGTDDTAALRLAHAASQRYVGAFPEVVGSVREYYPPGFYITTEATFSYRSTANIKGPRHHFGAGPYSSTIVLWPQSATQTWLYDSLNLQLFSQQTFKDLGFRAWGQYAGGIFGGNPSAAVKTNGYANGFREWSNGTEKKFGFENCSVGEGPTTFGIWHYRCGTGNADQTGYHKCEVRGCADAVHVYNNSQAIGDVLSGVNHTALIGDLFRFLDGSNGEGAGGGGEIAVLGGCANWVSDIDPSSAGTKSWLVSVPGNKPYYNVTKTSGSPNITIASGASTFLVGDVGLVVSGTGIPAGTTILTRTDATHAILSANATDSVGITLIQGNNNTNSNITFYGTHTEPYGSKVGYVNNPYSAGYFEVLFDNCKLNTSSGVILNPAVDIDFGAKVTFRGGISRTDLNCRINNIDAAQYSNRAPPIVQWLNSTIDPELSVRCTFTAGTYKFGRFIADGCSSMLFTDSPMTFRAMDFDMGWQYACVGGPTPKIKRAWIINPALVWPGAVAQTEKTTRLPANTVIVSSGMGMPAFTDAGHGADAYRVAITTSDKSTKTYNDSGAITWAAAIVGTIPSGSPILTDPSTWYPVGTATNTRDVRLAPVTAAGVGALTRFSGVTGIGGAYVDYI